MFSLTEVIINHWNLDYLSKLYFDLSIQNSKNIIVAVSERQESETRPGSHSDSVLSSSVTLGKSEYL